MRTTPETADTTSGGRGRHELRSDRLRALLADRGITQVALAAQMGMHRGHVNDVLQGRIRIGRTFMDGLRNTFPDDYDQLVVWVVDDNPAAPAAPR
ncbi:helix-turn-helix domain-containing protein [Pseudonocardia parietis]|uniref:Transcriptional regulator with XRE-family HTH domain n=1 Tax=Pseudonocardia parietis TaxID=570936 RepID=A0ABS4W259_9PSEU|nr:helix-turn-helix transcriptional regulator [Pseudonocardia parietis]MBP2370291.1 transcriptional regulator with XRE-family HTH domain [Pseudonocardia parietis]